MHCGCGVCKDLRRWMRFAMSHLDQVSCAVLGALYEEVGDQELHAKHQEALLAHCPQPLNKAQRTA